MNCLDYRRELTTAPREESAAMQAHRGGCAACAAFARGLREQEAQLASALHTRVPESLAARILFRQRTAEYLDGDLEARIGTAIGVAPPAGMQARILAAVAAGAGDGDARGEKDGGNDHRGAPTDGDAAVTSTPDDGPATGRRGGDGAARRRLTDQHVPAARRSLAPRGALRFAMAASLALAVAVGALISVSPSQPTVLDAVVDHIQTHRWSLDNNQPIPKPMVDPVLRMAGLELDEIPNAITHVTPCDVAKMRTVHLVMTGEHGKVSVFVMPDQHVDGAISGQRGEFGGLVLPVRHGSLAVVGSPREDLQAQALTVRRALRWRM